MALATENLLANEESVIAAAAAEAVALARAAAEVAKNAAQMVGSNPSSKYSKPDDFSSDFELLQIEMAKDAENELLGASAYAQIMEVGSDRNLPEGAHDYSSKINGFELLEPEHSENIAVRSGRQTERRARRARAAEKVGSSVISVKSGSSGRKKRGAVQEIDYSDPLHYLRATTSTSRLLTASEELELSEGIQVIFYIFLWGKYSCCQRVHFKLG